MFFISMLARYCFRKVEPDENSADSLSKPSSHKSNQTAFAGRDGGSPEPDSFSLGVNPGYSSDTEDAPYRIEHAPLDRFDFKAAKKPVLDSCFISVPLSERDEADEGCCSMLEMLRLSRFLGTVPLLCGVTLCFREQKFMPGNVDILPHEQLAPSWGSPKLEGHRFKVRRERDLRGNFFMQRV
eukprot:g25179.t1